MLRLLPQILKAIGYYDRHNIKKPKYAQFDLAFGKFKSKKSLHTS